MSGLQETLNRLVTLREETTKLLTDKEHVRNAIVTLAEQEGRKDLTPEETAEFRNFSKEIEALQEKVLGFDERIREQTAELERSGRMEEGAAIVRKATALVQEVREPVTYAKDNPDCSYLQDMCRVGMNMDYTGRAIERLRRHATDVETLPEYRKHHKEARALSRVDGAGGYAVPPLWMMGEYVELARPGRPLANAVTNQPLPPGTDSINIPKLLTGTATGAQNGDNTNVVAQDLTDTSVSAPVKTIAGQQDLAIQLLDQSPIEFDQVVFRDLVADYAAQVDAQVIAGTGTNGTILGILNTSGIFTVVCGALTAQGAYAALANAIQKIHGARHLPPQAVFMHPRRWGWFQSLFDGQNRPLFPPLAQFPQNAAGVLTNVASEQVVGNIQGLPIITDPNLPTTLGSETPTGTEDPILVMRLTDSILWESGVRTRAMPETLSGQLSVRLQVFGYLAFTAARYPQSCAEITGLTTPSF
jgi:HK97 family phage major capsid protein